MARKAVKMTFTLDPGCVEGLRTAVERGVAPSQSALVEEAVSRFLRESREELLEAEFRKAARDPEFLRDVSHTMTAFRRSDAEAGRKQK